MVTKKRRTKKTPGTTKKRSTRKGTTKKLNTKKRPTKKRPTKKRPTKKRPTKNPAKKRSRAGAKKADPFDVTNKPYIYLTELERQRADDEIGSMLDEPMVKDARNGPGVLLVAAALLVLPNQEERLLMHGDEWGDGEGSRLSEHTVAIVEPELKSGEKVRLDVVEVEMQRDGRCSTKVRAGEGYRHDDLDDIVRPSLQSDLDAARERQDSESAEFWLVVLTTTSGGRRIVSASMDDGNGGSRAQTASFVRRVRRLKWLEPGETIDRVKLMLRPAMGAWTAVATADPVAASGR
jgi:hypothetical protein